MKYLSIIKYVLGGISAVLVIMLFTANNYDTIVGPALTWAFALLILAAVLAIFMPVISIVQNPKQALRALFGIGIVAVFILIAYALSSDKPINMLGSMVTPTPGQLRFTDTSLYLIYFAMGGAILSILIGEIAILFKK